MREEHCDIAQKVVLLGDSTVGKTQLLNRFKGTFAVNPTSTIGINVASKMLIVNEKSVNIQIWDTCGQEQFRSAITPYYRDALGALVVYDITNSASFRSLGSWLDDVGERGAVNIAVILVGNKCDLEDTREVTIEEAQAFAESRKLELVETSALEDINVKEVFMRIIQKVCARAIVGESKSSLSLHSVNEKLEKKSGCHC